MVVFLVILAVFGWIGGSFMLTPATYGVGALAAGCLFAILARIAQASSQHRETMKILNAQWSALGGQTPPEWICMQCGTLAPGDVSICPGCTFSRPSPRVTQP